MRTGRDYKCLQYDRDCASAPAGRAPPPSRPPPRSRTGSPICRRSRDNPGNLLGRCYVPADLAGPAPLVVVLHGCTQNAAVYDHGSGWSRLADRHGFLLLFPEQQRANNPMLCFNWFSGDDSQRGMGEAASIRAMIEAMAKAHDVDPARIFVTGLSAGGAMASVMLATYPELFAAGAIIAGMAYGCASDVAGAFDCMSGRASADARELGAKVRRASPHKGPWPRVQVWQGSADHDGGAEQCRRDRAAMGRSPRAWREARPGRPGRRLSAPGLAWRGRQGADRAIYDHRHGPRHPARSRHRRGRIGRGRRPYARCRPELHRPHRRLLRHRAGAGGARGTRRAPRPPCRRARLRAAPRPSARPEPAGGVQEVIEKALKAAGLMR